MSHRGHGDSSGSEENATMLEHRKRIERQKARLRGQGDDSGNAEDGPRPQPPPREDGGSPEWGGGGSAPASVDDGALDADLRRSFVLGNGNGNGGGVAGVAGGAGGAGGRGSSTMSSSAGASAYNVSAECADGGAAASSSDVAVTVTDDGLEAGGAAAGADGAEYETAEFEARRDARPDELRRARKGVLFNPDSSGASVDRRKPVNPGVHFFSPSEPSSQAKSRARATGEKRALRSGDGSSFATADHMDTGPSVEERVIVKAEKQRHGYFMYTVSVLQVLALGFIMINDGLAPICVDQADCNPFIGPNPDALLDWGAKDSALIRDGGEWWRFVTPIFLHAGVVHILSNLAFQLRAGADLECLWGWWRVTAIYLISGVGGNVISAIVSPSTLSVGASGSLFGLLGSMFSEVLMNWRFMDNPGKQLCSLLIMTTITVAIGMLPMIDQFVHLGGLVFGFLIGFLFVPKHKARLVPFILRIVGTGLTIFGFVTAFTLFYEKPDYVCKACDLLNPWGTKSNSDSDTGDADT